LYYACGLNAPAWRQILLTDSFLDRNPESWIETKTGRERPPAGLCFGCAYLGTEGVQPFEVLPETSYARIRNRESFWMAWLVDICAEHTDNRQALFVKEEDGFAAHFVDSGNLFGGVTGDQQAHFTASRYLDPAIYPYVPTRRLQSLERKLEEIDADGLWRKACALPDQWRSATAFNGLGRCLQRLANHALVQNLLDTIVESVMRTRGGKIPPSSVPIDSGSLLWANARARQLGCL